MEEDENNNIVHDDGTNKLIQDLYTRRDDQDGDNDGIYDEPMIEKESNKRLKRKSSLRYIVIGEFKGF